VKFSEINWYILKQERGVYHDLQIIVWTVGLVVMYAGESKIICSLGTCFAVGYIGGWAWHDTHGLLSYPCGAVVTLIVHFCLDFCAINMDALLTLAPKKSRGQWSVFYGLKVCQVLKCYNEMLCDQLKPAIQSKRRAILSEGIVSLHDNAHPHTAAHTLEILKKINFEVLEQPPYSLDLSPSD
jgi:hypothetical protein